MPTVPATPRWEDFSFELVNLSDGTFTILTQQDILSADITWVPAPTTHKIESGYIEAPAGTEDNPSVLAAAWNWGGWQAIRVVPYGDPTVEAWGLLVNARFAYSGRAVRDTFKMSIVPIEFLLHSRVVYSATGTGFDGGNDPADDLAKRLVTGCTSGNDPGTNPRAWTLGTLVVQAPAGLCAAVTADYEIFEDYLDEIVEALSLEYGFVWELKPSVAAGALTFTFNTALAGGTDRTAGATRWVINDFAGRQPSGERTIDRSQLINAMHSRGITEVEIDAASIATYGRWEGIGDGEDSQGLAINLEFAQLRDGSNFTFANPEEWLGVWSVGDTVIRNNIRTGLAESSEVIGAVRTTWPERILSIDIRWGLKKGTYTQKNKKAAGRQGGGGGGRSTPGWALTTEPVSDDAYPPGHRGTSRLLNRADHQHSLFLTADDTNTATITAGAVTIEGHTYITTSIAAGDLRITHDDSGVAAAVYGSATQVPQITVDAQGHATLIANVAITGVPPSAHNLLSAYHGDTLTAAAARGAVIVGNATPAWSRLTVGAAGTAVGTTDGVSTTFMNPAPSAHGIVSAYHTGAGAALSVIGFSALNTLGVLIPSSAPGAVASLLVTTAAGWLRLVRLEVASANVYVSGVGNWCILSGTSGVALQDSGVSIVGITAASGIYPDANNTYTNGIAAKRWSNVNSVLGNFTGDITIGTGVGIIHADGVAAGKVLRANGTRYVPATLAATDCSGYSTHTHTYSKAVATGNNSDFSDPSVVRSGPHVTGPWCYTSDAADGSSPTWSKLQLDDGTHVHTNAAFAWTYTPTASGAP